MSPLRRSGESIRQKACAIITARGGSKGLPRKNLRLFLGEPLIVHSIRAALECDLVDRCLVSTEDPEIREVSLRAGAEVVDRPSELATDTALSRDVVRHVLLWLSESGRLPEYFALLQPTSPLRTSSHLSECLGIFLNDCDGSVLSVAHVGDHPYKMLKVDNGNLSPLFGFEEMEMPRQLLPDVFRQNGAIYVLSCADFLKHNSFFVEPVRSYVMDEVSSIDVDSLLDIQFAEYIAKRQIGEHWPYKDFLGVPRVVGKEMDFRSLNRDVSWRVGVAREQRAVADRLRSAMVSIDRCPICSGSSIERYAEVFEYIYGRCGSCRHIFCTTAPDPEAVRQLYGGDESERTIQGMIYLDETIFHQRVQRIAKPKVAFVAGHIPANGVWVDVGSGAGEVLIAARESGWTARGIEADAAEVEFARQKDLEVTRNYLNGENADELLGDANVVSFFNVLEHIPDPRTLLRAASRALGPEGHIVIEVPRDPSLSSLNCAAFPDLACRHIYPPDHLHVFTEKSLGIMLKDAGLEALAIWTFGQDFYDLITCTAAKAGKSAASLYEAALTVVPTIQQVVDDAGLSDTVVVLCKKRLRSS